MQFMLAKRLNRVENTRNWLSKGGCPKKPLVGSGSKVKKTPQLYSILTFGQTETMPFSTSSRAHKANQWPSRSDVARCLNWEYACCTTLCAPGRTPGRPTGISIAPSVPWSKKQNKFKFAHRCLKQLAKMFAAVRRRKCFVICVHLHGTAWTL